MTDVRTQNVIDALTELGFERSMANDSHALYDHPAGASVSLPHSRPHVSGALLKAIERQVAGFGIAPAHVFGEKVNALHRVAPLTGEAGDDSAGTIGSGAAPARSAFDRETGGHRAASTPRSRWCTIASESHNPTLPARFTMRTSDEREQARYAHLFP